MARPGNGKKIKSAVRVLELLEYFNMRRSDVTVMEISRALDYPQSSTSELLTCLVDLGLVYRNKYERTYRLTARVATLGAWVNPSLFRSGVLFTLMDELAGSTGSNLAFGGIVGVRVQHFHEVRNIPSIGLMSSEAEPLTRSAMGKALLATYDFDFIRKLVHRINAESEARHPIRCDDLLGEIQTIRRQGFAISGTSSAVVLPQQGDDAALALEISPPHHAEHDAEYYAHALYDSVARRIGTFSWPVPTKNMPTHMPRRSNAIDRIHANSPRTLRLPERLAS